MGRGLCSIIERFAHILLCFGKWDLYCQLYIIVSIYGVFVLYFVRKLI